MIDRDDFDRQIVAWLTDDAGDGVPDYLSLVLGRVERTKQRPAWAAVPSWRPLDRALRRVEFAPAFLIVIVLGLLLIAVAAAAIVGSHRPRLGPLIALPEQTHPPSVLPSESAPPWLESARLAKL